MGGGQPPLPGDRGRLGAGVAEDAREPPAVHLCNHGGDVHLRGRAADRVFDQEASRDIPSQKHSQQRAGLLPPAWVAVRGAWRPASPPPARALSRRLRATPFSPRRWFAALALSRPPPAANRLPWRAFSPAPRRH